MIWNESFGVKAVSTHKRIVILAYALARMENGFLCVFFVIPILTFIFGIYLPIYNSNSTGFLLPLFWYGLVFMQISAGKGMGHFNPFGSLCQITTVIWWFSAAAEWWLACSSKQTVTLEWDLLSSDAYGHVTMKTFHWQNKVLVSPSWTGQSNRGPVTLKVLRVCVMDTFSFITGE